jgi:hypothetical protein
MGAFASTQSAPGPLGPRGSDRRRIGLAGWASRKPESVAGSDSEFVVWHRYAVVTPSKGGSLHPPAWQQVNPDKPRLLVISSAGGSDKVIDGPSWLTGPYGEPMSAKVTGGADRRLTK